MNCVARKQKRIQRNCDFHIGEKKNIPKYLCFESIYTNFTTKEEKTFTYPISMAIMCSV